MWSIKKGSESFSSLTLKLEFDNYDEVEMFTKGKLRFDFGLQARLQGAPFLDVYLNNRRMLMEEHPHIYSIVDQLLTDKYITIECYNRDFEVDEPMETIHRYFGEYELSALGIVISQCRFRSNYGFYEGEHNYGV